MHYKPHLTSLNLTQLELPSLFESLHESLLESLLESMYWAGAGAGGRGGRGKSPSPSAPLPGGLLCTLSSFFFLASLLDVLDLAEGREKGGSGAQ